MTAQLMTAQLMVVACILQRSQLHVRQLRSDESYAVALQAQEAYTEVACKGIGDQVACGRQYLSLILAWCF